MRKRLRKGGFAKDESRDFSDSGTLIDSPRIKKAYKVEDPTVAKFLHGQLKVRKLTPIPDVNQYSVDQFAKNPLMKFKLSAGKARRVYEFLEEQAIRNKIQTYRARSKDPVVEPLPKSKLECHRLLREYASARETPHLQQSWISSIQKKLHGLQLRFPDIASSLLTEVKQIFYEEMHKFGIDLIVKPIPGTLLKVINEPRLDDGGKTARYPIFIRRREFLKAKLYILHPLQRQIFMSSVDSLPATFVDFIKYRSHGVLELAALEELVYGDLKRAEHLVTTTFYGQVVSILERKSAWRSIPVKNRVKFLNSATNILCVQISSLIYRSIEHLLWLTEDEQRMPQLKLNIVCDTALHLLPSQQKIYKTFHGFLDELANTAQKLAPLETWVDDVPIPRGNINVAVNKSYMTQSHAKLQINLEKVLDEINRYIARLNSKHEAMFSRKKFADLDNFITETHTFEELVEKRAEFQEYMDSLDDILVNDYFSMGRICQYDLIKTLKELAAEFCAILMSKIFKFHALENQAICQTFQELKEKALKEPDSTEELIDMGNFMLGASAAMVHGLEEKIVAQLQKMSVIIHLVEVPPDYILLMSQTVNWITEIKPVFEQNTAQYEQQKFEFEERLQKRTETLGKDLDELGPKLVVLNNMDDTSRLPDYLQEIRKFLTILDGLDKDVQWINHEEFLFKFPVSTYPELDELHNFINPFAKLLFLTHRWQWKRRVWMNGSFQDLDATTVESTTEQFLKDFVETQKMYKAKIKQQVQDNVARRFKGNVDDPDPNNIPVPIKLCNRTLEQIKEFKVHVPLVKILCNKALMQRHWDEMSVICGFDITPDYGTTLRKVIKMELAPYLDRFEIISIGACKELQLSENLKNMWREWTTVEFTVTNWKEHRILSELDGIQALLDDHLTKTVNMRGSAFVKPFEQEVVNWFSTLDLVNRTIEEWEKVQMQWLSLLPIFSSVGIADQIVVEAVMFKDVDSAYNNIIINTVNNPKVLATVGSSAMFESLKRLTAMLESVNIGVNRYLEQTRLNFPRFFFMSNEDILDIMSDSENPHRVQPHLSKCFQGISALEMDDDFIIKSMRSSEGEVVSFSEEVPTKSMGSVEKWLLQVEQQMKSTIRDYIGEAYETYPTGSHSEWIQRWPGQVVLCVSAILWTFHTHQHLQSTEPDALAAYLDQLNHRLNDTVNLVRGDVPKVMRVTLGTLIIQEVNARDVVEGLVRENVRSVTAFAWIANMRYYWSDGDCSVRMMNASIQYAYEYLGNTDRLVVTPLTDRCFNTLIGAYYMHLNGATEGATGTGKTQVIKDLAKALAVQCIVFTCSERLGYVVMSKFLKGMAATGAWVCFDEFNRITMEVLSVVAQQMACIMRAVQASLKKFMFEGTEMNLNPSCYVCITLNPGFPKRSDLPDNLRVLFRSVSMMVPDNALIAEVLLFSLGFERSRDLAVKIDATHRLCSDTVSAQPHYDFSLRTVKTVLSIASQLKLTHPDLDEHVVVFQAIISVNKPKLLRSDALLFDNIVMDIFPGTKPSISDNSLLTNAAESVCKSLNLQFVDYFRDKLIEVHDVMSAQLGIMLVGDSYSGKSSVLRVLAGALDQLGSKVDIVTVNPKSVALDQLFGKFNSVTNEWSDGIFADILRTFTSGADCSQEWLILDGPIDLSWAENFNSVLDDSGKLCLNSGEIISMSKDMKCIFELSDLYQASPTILSRCGILFMEPKALGWQVLVQSWMTNQNSWISDHVEFILDLLNWLVPPSLDFIRNNCVMIAKVGDSSKVVAMLQIAGMLVSDACKNQPAQIQVWIQAALLYGGVWGLGGALNQNSRSSFSDFYLELWRGNVDNFPIPNSLGRADVTLPTEGTLYDYCYNFKSKGNWRQCADILKQEKVEEPLNLAQMLVPTVDTVRYSALINLHIRHNNPLLLVGPTGTGKSVLMQNILTTKVDSATCHPAFVTFTQSTSAKETQKLIISKLIKRKRNLFGPPAGQRCILHVDDLHMPVKDTSGAQPALELLRQYMNSGSWFDIKTDKPILLEDVLILSSMGLSGGCRQEITSRLLRHFNVFTVNDANEESMNRIYTAVLFAGLKRNGFASDAMTAVCGIVNATMDIYSATLAELRPTPNKPHYGFNLRDFAKVVQGCYMIKKESVDSRKTFAKLWVHETMRVFYDRLIDDRERTWMYERIRSCVKEHLKENFDHVFDNLKLEDGVCTEAALKDLMFGCYLDQEASEEDRKYEEVANVDQLFEVASSLLAEYNSTHSPKLDLVLFRYALEHLSRICRILALPGGNGLLVGLSGSGRQSLTRLASVMMGYHFFQPEITTKYSTAEWRSDLKSVLKQAGGRARSTAFLFSGTQMKDESFILDIDALLSLGEVPELFDLDEKQEILEMVRLSAQGGNRNLDISPLTVFNFFVSRCKQRLHLLLCFSPIGSNFRRRLNKYPSLVNCCTINWFNDWPVEALDMVAKKLMVGVNLTDEIKSAVVSASKYYHTSAKELSLKYEVETKRKTYITSAAFLELISSFSSLTIKTQEETKASKLRYVVGLEKLEFAANQVTAMSKELSELKPKLEVAKNMTVEMMKNIEVEKKKVESAADLVKKDEQVANEQAAAAMDLKAECEADLAQAIPILEEAIAALNTLKPTDITLVKSMKNPPDAIKLVMAAVCVMKDVKPDRMPDPATGKKMLDYWGPSKRVLGDMAFLQQLKEYDKDNISADIMVKIRKEYIPHKDFKPNVVAKASSAAEGLCKWVIAMDLYDAVAKEVAPKKAKLEVAEREYADTMVLLNQKRAEVSKLEEQLGEFMQKLLENQEKKQKLEDDVNQCSNKLHRAEKLIDGLGGEKSRWEGSAAQLQENYDAIAGDVLISCGVISYLSPFAGSYRQEAVLDWHNKCIQLAIPCSSNYTFSTTLGSRVKIQNWQIFGLPKDQFSTDNAIIMDSSKKWPLLVDSHGLGNNWIKGMERKNNLAVVKITDCNYMKVVIDCIMSGRPALLENIVESLDAALDPILNRTIFQENDKLFINLRNDVYEYNNNFKLYLTSSVRNPHYQPEMYNKVRIINFELTMEGLEDQLLGIVVAKERPDLQTQRQELIVQSAKNKKDLLAVEAMILQTLSGTKGNILEDESAIETLDSSKVLSQTIKMEQESSRETKKMIESFRSNYRPIAAHSAVLYYCISDLINVNIMYQYSLTWFIKLFLSSIDSANKSKILEKRIQFLRETVTHDLYSNVCRSLFDQDKLLFSFILCCKILIAEGNLDTREFTFLVNGSKNNEFNQKHPGIPWLKDNSWQQLCHLSSFPAFVGLTEHIISNPREWQIFYDLYRPTFEDVPLYCSNKLTRFQNLILLKVLRPDRVIPNITLFVGLQFGEKYVQLPTFDLSISFKESNCLCPLVLVLSPGCDPMAALTTFADKKGALTKFKSVSLGQERGPIAAKLIAEAQIEGTWVCLQNCHLAPSWMPTLEKIWEAMDTTNTSLEFRLWLTSQPSFEFPSGILQNSVKMTNETPDDLKAKMLRSFSSHPICDKSFFEGCPGKNIVFGKLLYGLTFFHAVVQERKKFGPIGWNKPYKFDDSDFLISIQQLKTFIQDSTETPLEAVCYLTGECNYGGQVDNEWDRRTLITILSDFVNGRVVSVPNYSFAPGSLFGLPKKTGYQNYLEYISNVPSEPLPEVFGLHINAGVMHGINRANTLFSSILAFEGTAIQSSETEENARDLSNQILSNLPDYFDIRLASEMFPVSYSECMNVLLVQELSRFNALLYVIKETLQQLIDAVSGFVSMSPEVEKVLTSLQRGEIPGSWRRFVYNTIKPLGPFISDLHQRLSFFQGWLDNGKPSTFWISAFYSPRGFLTGVLQNHARKFSLPIELLTFDFVVITVLPDDTEGSAFISGLFLDGALWNSTNNRIDELTPFKSYDKLPTVQLKPLHKSDLNERGRFNCPLFQTSQRLGVLHPNASLHNNVVIPFLLETHLPCSHWVKRGVALLCQLD